MQQPEDLKSILTKAGHAPEWKERRGRKQKYFFYDMQKGEIRKKTVPISKARAIQSAAKRAANKQKILISIQNHGTFLLIKRIK